MKDWATAGTNRLPYILYQACKHTRVDVRTQQHRAEILSDKVSHNFLARFHKITPPREKVKNT